SGPFSDVSGPHAGAINALAARDIIRGKGDGTFDPQGTITRDQVASMLARHLELPGVERDVFTDVPSANPHRAAINALAGIGVARGTSATTYGPREALRRDQAASFVSRGLEHADDGPGGPDPTCPVPSTPSLDVAHVVARSSAIAGCDLELQLGVDAVDDLDPDGATLRVVGSGFPGDGVATPGGVDCDAGGAGAHCAGIYVSVCVLGAAHLDGPPASGAAPSPCLGGVDLEGETGASRWISDHPPSYGAGLAEPFGPGGTFDAELHVAATDGEVDCREAEHGCAVVVRRDHLAAGDRSLDLYVPIEFAAAPDFSEPRISLSATEVAVGDTITVTGAGFDPDANLSTRQPVTAGEPAGVYVVFGRFAETWRPSAGAPGSARHVVSQRWAMPASSRDQVASDFPGVAGQLVELRPDGTFEAELAVARGSATSGDYGVYVYAGGGAPANADQELAAPVTLLPDAVTGDATWGVKASFRNYVTGPIAHGTITVSEGAVRNDDGTFGFGDGAGVSDPVAGTLDVAFGGRVRFDGHGGLLQLELADPRIVVDADGARLIADARSKSFTDGEMVEYPDAHVADLDLTGVTPTVVDGVTTYAAVPATLTEEGVPAFASFYAAGEALDRVTFSYRAAG
ncbi:hypothetical protein FTX61_21640, partial [Nitriliruptoraceae bacterium ZYF776]|nr:hypothetical protein [Profundirhabdus halotolerans]